MTPAFALLSTDFSEALAFSALVDREDVVQVHNLDAFEALGPLTPLVVGPHFGHLDSLALLPLVSHHPVVLLCDDAKIDAAFEAGATDILPLDASIESIERAVSMASRRHTRLSRLKTRVDDLRAALAALPVGMVVLEGETIVYENASVAALLDGVSFLGENIETLFHGDDLVIWDTPVRPAELRLRPNRVGDSKIVQVSEVSTLQTRDGNLSLLVIQDVTAERSLTTRLHQAERSSSLQNIALEIAHEVNNPLAIFAQDLPELAALVEENWNPAEREVIDEILEELSAATNRISGAVTTLRAAANTVEATSELGAVIDAARASASMRTAEQFAFAALSASSHRKALAIDPATATPLLRATFSFAAAYAARVQVNASEHADVCEIECILQGDRSLELARKVAGNLSPAHLTMMDCEWAQALSVELSIARRAGVQLLCIHRDGDVRLTIRAPLVVEPRQGDTSLRAADREQREVERLIDAFAGGGMHDDVATDDTTSTPRRSSSTVVQVPTLAH